MPCVSGLYTKNPTKSFVSGRDRLNLLVPCGKCEGCRTTMRNSWAIRLYSDLRSYISKGWYCGFVTLTYKNSHLPMFSYTRKNGSIGSFPCFNRKDITRFIRNIKKHLNREFGITGIQYFICSEYGDSNKRPHYHMSIMCPPASGFSSRDLYDLIKHYWSDPIYGKSHKYGKLVLDKSKVLSTGHGLILPKNYYGGYYDGQYHKPFIIEDAEAGAKYASKYVVKDLSWYQIPAIDEFFDNASEEDLERFKLVSPKHWQGQGLGISLLENFNDEHSFDTLLNGFHFLSDAVSLPYPEYIKRKLCYEYDRDSDGHLIKYYRNDGTLYYKRRLSDFGVNFKLYQKQSTFLETANKLEFEMSFLNLSQLCSGNSYLFRSGSYAGMTSVGELYDHLHDLMNGRTPLDLALYKLYYKDFSCPSRRICDFFDLDFSGWFSTMSLSQLHKMAVPFEEFKLSLPDDYGVELDKHVYSQECFKLFNNIDAFKGFDEILSILQDIKTAHYVPHYDSIVNRSKAKERTRFLVYGIT